MSTLELEKLLQQPDENINLAEGALMVARLEYADLDIEKYLHHIQLLAEEIQKRLPANPNAGDTLNQLNQVLFVENGFSGNTDDYYNPRNSFLNNVIDSRKGVPISLAVVYLQLGELLNLPLLGVSFPGHFLVKLDIDDGAIVLDPYYGGISLTEENIFERLYDYYGEQAKSMSVHGLLVGASKLDIIIRIMRNLRNLYIHDKEWTRALVMADIMVKFDSDQSDVIKARAIIYDALECSNAALLDYKKYLDITPDAQDTMNIRSRIMQLSEACRYIN